MSGVRVEGDFRKLRHSLSKLQNFNYSALNKDIGEELKLQTADRFKKQEDPKGNPWKVSIRVRENGGQILSNNATLKNSIKYRAREEGVAIGTNLVYAATHQNGDEGRTIRAKTTKGLRFKINGKWKNKKEVKVNIPARAFLGVSDENLADINEILEEHIRENLE